MLGQNNESCNTKNSTETTSRRPAGTACTDPVTCFELHAANRHPTRREFWFDADSNEHHHTDSIEWYRFVPFRSSVGSLCRSYCVADTSACRYWCRSGRFCIGCSGCSLSGHVTQSPCGPLPYRYLFRCCIGSSYSLCTAVRHPLWFILLVDTAAGICGCNAHGLASLCYRSCWWSDPCRDIAIGRRGHSCRSGSLPDTHFDAQPTCSV